MTGSQLRVLRWLSWVIVLLIGLALPTIFKRAPDVIETVYARGVFPWVARVLAPIGRTVPFSVAQLIVVGAILAIVLEVVRTMRDYRAGRDAIAAKAPDPATGPGADPGTDPSAHPAPPRARAARAFQRSSFRWIRVATIVVWTFHLVWGLNYARPPLRERLNLPEIPPNSERLTRLTRALVLETNRAYTLAIELGEAVPDTIRGTQFRLDEQALWEALDRGYGVVEPRLKGISFSSPKLPTPAGSVLSRLGISGVYFPFTGEATVNGKMPTVSYPFVAAHEMAHQRGIAREDEANALAYLACRQAGRWITRYSGALSAYRRSLSALWRTDPDSAREVAQLLAPGPRRDQAIIREFWQSQQGPASEAAGKVNDTYLKANAQKDGVASYGRMVDLLIILNELDMLRD